MRGKPISPRSSTTQKLTESRISGSCGRFASMYSRAGSIPPVRSIAIEYPLLLGISVRSPLARAVHIMGEPGPHLVEINAEFHRVGMRTRLTVGGSMRPPALHLCFELRSDWGTQPRVQAGDLGDRIVLHRAKVDVVEPIIGAVGAEL